jgi:hypothetical protein
MIDAKIFIEHGNATHKGISCVGDEAHFFIPLSTWFSKSERSESTHVKSMICQKCLWSVSIGDEYNKRMGEIAKEIG